MKDYNYYKTLADVYTKFNEVFNKFKVKNIIPIEKIYIEREPDQGNRFILEGEEGKYFMLETSTELFWDFIDYRIKALNNLDINVTKLLHRFTQEDHNNERHTLFIYEYFDGESLKDYLKKTTPEEAYELGVNLGKTLITTHLKVVNVLAYHVSNWYRSYRWVQKRLLEQYERNEVIEKAMDYCIEYQSLIETRYSTSEYYRKENGIYIKDENGNQVIEKVLAFIYDDIKIDNLMVCDGKVYIKTPINVNIGDPFYDFKYLSLIALENEDFASGILDGYFDGKFSKDFFIMLKYYTSELIITGYNKHLDKDTVDKIIDSYDDYTLEIPKWYKTRLDK